MQAPSTPEGASEQVVDVISNIEALLRDDDDDDCYTRPEPTVVDNQHFFVVSTPATPLNAKLSALNSTMSTAAPPFRPRGSPMPTMLAGTKTGEGLFSSGPTPPPFSGFGGPIHVTTMSTPPPPSIPRTSSIRDAVKPGFVCLDTLRAFTDKYYAVIVNNLDPRTQTKHLMSIFFPLGAIDALAFQSPVGTEEIGLQFAGRKGGIVLFNSAEMASMAATKIDDFVPHGQTMPLHASYFGRFEDYLAAKGTYTMNRASALSGENGYGPSGGHMHRGGGVATAALLSASAAASVVAANSLLSGSAAASNCPSPVKPLASVSAGVDNSSAQHLASVFLRAAETSDAEADKALDSLLRRFAIEPINRASLVITVLTAIHKEKDRLPFASHFLRSLSQYIIQTGLMDLDSPRDLKMSCGTICGAMFALQILRGNPFGMALHITNELIMSKIHEEAEEAENGEKGQESTKEGASSPSSSSSSVLSDGQINTIDALMVLGKSWYSRAPNELTADKSPFEEEFKNAVKRLKDEGRYPTSLVAHTHSTTPPSLSTPVSRTVPSASSFPSNIEESRRRPLSSSGSEEPEAEPVSTNGTAASSTSSFFVSATPVRGAKPSSMVAVGVPQTTMTSVRALNVSTGSTPAGAMATGLGPHDVSIESNVSSVGPRYAASAVQTPHKQSFRATARDASPLVLTKDNTPTPVTATTGGGGVVGGYFTTGGVVNHHHHQSTSNGLMPLTHHLAAGQHPSLVVGPAASSQFNVNVNLLSAFEGTNIQQHLMDATVYMTKVPLNLPHSTLRKLFAFFGEFNKVRICEEKKKPAANPTISIDAAGSFANNGGRSGYGFVEFAVPASSKAMVDFFRNRSESIPQRMGIDPLQMKEILLMRVSFARSCIHDHDPDDAVFDCSDATTCMQPQHDADSAGRKIKACTFGLAS